MHDPEKCKPVFGQDHAQISYPHGEEARSAVSNHEATIRALILRDAAKTPPLGLMVQQHQRPGLRLRRIPA